MREKNRAAYGMLPIETDKKFPLFCSSVFLMTKREARRTQHAESREAQPQEDSPALLTPNRDCESAAFREWEQLWKSILRKNRTSMRKTHVQRGHFSTRSPQMRVPQSEPRVSSTCETSMISQ